MCGSLSKQTSLQSPVNHRFEETFPYPSRLQRQHNVILVDWLNGAGPYDFFYPLAVVNTELVGRQIAVLLHQLMSTYALKPLTIHYVGHSLGAQCGHFFAEYFKKISGGMRINQITGEQL